MCFNNSCFCSILRTYAQILCLFSDASLWVKGNCNKIYKQNSVRETIETLERFRKETTLPLRTHVTHCSLSNLVLKKADFFFTPKWLPCYTSGFVTIIIYHFWWHFIVLNVLNAFEIYVSSFVGSILSDSHTGYKNILYLREQIAYGS